MPTLSTLPASIRTVSAGYDSLGIEIELDLVASTGLPMGLVFLDDEGLLWPTRVGDVGGPAEGSKQTVFARLTASVPGRGTVTTTTWAAGFEVASSVGFQAGTRWRLVLPAQTEDEPHGLLGWARDYQGKPPPGQCAAMKIELIYRTSVGTEIAYAILDDGIPGASVRTIEFSDPRSQRMRHLIEITGFGPEARLDRRQIGYQLDPSHGKSHGTMIGEASLLGGLAATSLGFGAELGAELNNSLDVDQDPCWQLLQEIARGGGRWLWWDYDGAPDLQAVEIAPQEEPVITFELRDLVKMAPPREEASTDTPTLVRVISSKIQRAPDSTGTVTTIQVVKTFGPFTLEVAKFHQQPSGPPTEGDLQPTGGIDKVFDLTLVQRTELTRVTTDGCLDIQGVLVYGYRNLEQVRYQTDTAGEINGYLHTAIFNADAVKDDLSPGFAFTWPKFMLTNIDVVVPTRDDDGREVTLEKYSGRWTNPRRSRKTSGTPGADWPSVPFYANETVLGNRHGVKLDRERLHVGSEGFILLPGNYSAINEWVTGEIITRQADDANLITKETKIGKAIAKTPGERYWYADGSTSNLFQEDFITISQVVETMADDTIDGQIFTTTTTTDVAGNVVPGGVVAGVSDGTRKGIPICSQELIDRMSSQRITSERSIQAECRQPIERVENNRFAESGDLADDLADRLLRWLTATVLVFTIPSNASLSRLLGRRARVVFPDPVGYEGTGWVQGVRQFADIADDGRPRFYTEIIFLWGWVE